MTVLIASTSAPQKGRRPPPAARSSRGAARRPSSARRPWSAAGRWSVPVIARPRLQTRRPGLEKGVPPAAQSRRPHRRFARRDLQRLASQQPQRRVPLATRRQPPLPARSRDRSDIQGLRARPSFALITLHLNTSVGSIRPSGMSQKTRTEEAPRSRGKNEKVAWAVFSASWRGAGRTATERTSRSPDRAPPAARVAPQGFGPRRLEGRHDLRRPRRDALGPRVAALRLRREAPRRATPGVPPDDRRDRNAKASRSTSAAQPPIDLRQRPRSQVHR